MQGITSAHEDVSQVMKFHAFTKRQLTELQDVMHEVEAERNPSNPRSLHVA
jgi:hypothetical protein